MNADGTPIPESGKLLAEQIPTYRNERRRRYRDQTAPSKNESRTSECELIIGLARRWLPYGGPPEEETFQLFGLTRSRYVELLWATILKEDCDGTLTAELASTYEHPAQRRGSRAEPDRTLTGYLRSPTSSSSNSRALANQSARTW